MLKGGLVLEGKVDSTARVSLGKVILYVTVGKKRASKCYPNANAKKVPGAVTVRVRVWH